MAKASEYEVHCPQCNVTFPVGTKRCLHCGAPTGPSPRSDSRARWNDTSRRYEAAPAGAGGPEFMLRPRPVDAEPDDEEMADVGRGGLLRVGVTVLWILLAVGFSVLRACSER